MPAPDDIIKAIQQAIPNAKMVDFQSPGNPAYINWLKHPPTFYCSDYSNGVTPPRLKYCSHQCEACIELLKRRNDIAFVKSILPDSYTVKESAHKGSIHCVSKTGIVHKVDADDDEHWEYIVKAIRNHFGPRFSEIDHNTNFCHIDFTIYLKSPKP